MRERVSRPTAGKREIVRGASVFVYVCRGVSVGVWWGRTATHDATACPLAHYARNLHTPHQQHRDPFGSVESVKAASDVYAPISGEVVEANTVRGLLAVKKKGKRGFRPSLWGHGHGHAYMYIQTYHPEPPLHAHTTPPPCLYIPYIRPCIILTPPRHTHNPSLPLLLFRP